MSSQSVCFNRRSAILSAFAAVLAWFGWKPRVKWEPLVQSQSVSCVLRDLKPRVELMTEEEI